MVRFLKVSVLCLGMLATSGALSAALADPTQQVFESAMQGDAKAQFAMGMYFFSTPMGENQGPNYQEALAWFTRAADQGNLEAQFILGRMYYIGQGVPKDIKQAEAWFTKAADGGGAAAQYRLGQMFQNGEGVARDFAIAHAWYNLSALAGYEMAKGARDALARQMTTDQIRQAQKRVIDWQTAHAAKDGKMPESQH